MKYKEKVEIFTIILYYEQRIPANIQVLEKNWLIFGKMCLKNIVDMCFFQKKKKKVLKIHPVYTLYCQVSFGRLSLCLCRAERAASG